MTYIEEYYNEIKKGKIEASHKVKVVYKKLVQDIKTPHTVSFYNEITEENETHTFIFDIKKANRPIEFI